MKKIIIVLVTLILSACSETNTRALKAASNTWIGYESLYITNEFNLLPQGRLEVTRYPNATEVMEQFKNKKVDIAALTLDEVMMLIDQGVDLHIFAVMDVSDGADQVVVSPAIKSIEDIKGQTIAVEETALGALMLHSFMLNSGLKPEDLTVLSSTVDKHASLYKSGAIQAAISFPPFSDELINLNAKKMFDSSEMKQAKIVDVLIVSPEVYREHKAQLKELTFALNGAVDLLKQQTADVLAFSGANLGLPKEAWPLMLDGVLIGDKSINVEYLHRYKLESIMLILDEILVKNGLLNKSVKPKITSDLFVRF